jgi:CBS domain-containing protein
MSVALHMSAPVVTISADAPLQLAAARLVERSCLVVVGGGEPIGMFCRCNLLRAGRLRAQMSGSWRLLSIPRMAVRQRMTTPLVTISRQQSVAEAAAKMVSAKVHRVVVVDGELAVGLLSTSDVMRALALTRNAAPLASCMSSPVITVESQEPLAAALDRMLIASVHGLVVTENGWPIGVFTQREALEAADLDARVPVEEAMSDAMVCLPSKTPICRAAADALASRARRVLAVDGRKLRGIVTGLDVARVASLGAA